MAKKNRKHHTPRARKKRGATQVGLPPGSLVYTGEHVDSPVEISILEYDAGHLEEIPLASLEQCRARSASPRVLWINVSGLTDIALVQRLGESFGLHPLTLEDILNTDQRPKVDDLGSHLYIVAKMLECPTTGHEIRTEQVSLVLGPNHLLSFLEDPGDVFDAVRDRIRRDQGRVRHSGADYLAYRLIDAIVDEYFIVMERVGDRLEELETELIEKPDAAAFARLYEVKREIIGLRRSILPMRDVVVTLTRGETAVLRPQTAIFFRDVHDHMLHVIETFESYRELSASLFDLYLTSQNNRMNEVMKILTIITTIFIPLSFIAGVYGMNFEQMPELSEPWGYPAVLGLMAVVVVGMLIWFRRKTWI